MRHRILRGAVPLETCERARRRLWQYVRHLGLSMEDIDQLNGNCWKPPVRFDSIFDEIRKHVERVADMDGDTKWSDLQILIRLPDYDTGIAIPAHVDHMLIDGEDPNIWQGRAIYGVELTQGRPRGGSTCIRPSVTDVHDVKEIVLNPGDILEMPANLMHSGSYNMGPDVRIALFYRLLERK